MIWKKHVLSAWINQHEMLKQIIHALLNPFFKECFLAFLKSTICWQCTRPWHPSHFTSHGPGLEETNKPTFLEIPRKHEEACRYLKDVTDSWVSRGALSFSLLLRIRFLAQISTPPSSPVGTQTWSCIFHMKKPYNTAWIGERAEELEISPTNKTAICESLENLF